MAHIVGVTVAQLVVYTLLILFNWMAVLSRLYVRVFLVKHLGPDDYFMMAALVGFTTIAGLALRMTILGAGQHTSILSHAEELGILKMFWCEELLYGFTTVALKFSIMHLLLRLAAERPHILLLKWTTYFYLASSVSFVTTSIFQCWPIAAYWNTDMHGHCIPLNVYTTLVYLNAVINLVTDGIFSILPTVLIWHIQLDRKTKISISVVLGLGITTCGVNIARFDYIEALKETADRTYVLFPIGLTSILEVAIGIMAASLGTLRPLLRKIRWKRISVSVPSLCRPSPKEGSVNSHESDAANQGHGIHQRDVEEWREICQSANSRARFDSKSLTILQSLPEENQQLPLPMLELGQINSREMQVSEHPVRGLLAC